jgi:hypothetical protein
MIATLHQRKLPHESASTLIETMRVILLGGMPSKHQGFHPE